LVVISSADVYRTYDRFRKKDPGPPDPWPLTEDSPLRDLLYPYREPDTEPSSFAYDYDKILMERAAQSEPEALPATVLRLPMVYGPGDYQHRLFPYLKRMDDHRRAILLSDGMAGWRAPRGYVEDLGEAIARCVTRPEAAGRTYHVADQENLTEADWVRRIGAAAGWSGETAALPNPRLPEAYRDQYDHRQEWSLDSTRIRGELGYREVTSPEEAMRRTVEWERANPPASFDPAQFDYEAEDRALDT
jgi:nucleoside-diphosphate-sugar epimerase